MGTHICGKCGGTGKVYPDREKGSIAPDETPPGPELCPDCGGDGIDGSTPEGKKVRRIQAKRASADE